MSPSGAYNIQSVNVAIVIHIQVSSKWCPSIKVTTGDFTEKIALVQITAVVW